MYQKELQIAIRAVKKSESTFRKYFGTRTKVEIKDGNYRDLVSYADKKIEKDIKKILARNFSKYGFIGEESGIINLNAKYKWVLDPIDGTTNYLQGSPDCAISLALMKNDSPIVGVIYEPILGYLYAARKKAGATMNGKKIKVSNIHDLKTAYGSFGWGRDINFAKKMFPKLVPVVGKMRVLGSAVVTLCNVAKGISDFLIGSGMKVWDYAAAQIILEEAGGVFINSEKPALQIAANPILAKKLFKLAKSLNSRS